MWGLIIMLFLSVHDFSSIIEAFHLPQTLENKLDNILNLNSHFYDMINGQISPDNIIFFALATLISLGLNIASIEFKKN